MQRHTRWLAPTLDSGYRGNKANESDNYSRRFNGEIFVKPSSCSLLKLTDLPQQKPTNRHQEAWFQILLKTPAKHQNTKIPFFPQHHRGTLLRRVLDPLPAARDGCWPSSTRVFRALQVRVRRFSSSARVRHVSGTKVLSTKVMPCCLHSLLSGTGSQNMLKVYLFY